ncbi:MAG: PEP-CTERM sorting domain-containing protein [Nitrospirae bacterium]|nr:PEP-CTERM sorting domain-containing protein [Nitrospirota bacterium]
MKRFVLCIALIISIFSGYSESDAISIGFVPADQDVILGNVANVDLFISGLTDVSVGAYDLDIHYNPAVLSFNSISFGPALGFSISFFDEVIPGSLNFFEFSLESPTDLNDGQPDNFVIASLSFNTLALGISPLGVSIIDLGDAYGEGLLADTRSGNIEVVSGNVPIPEPSTILLSGIGLAGLGFFRRKKDR